MASNRPPGQGLMLCNIITRNKETLTGMRLVIVAVHLRCWQMQWQAEFLVREIVVVPVPDIWKSAADTGLCWLLLPVCWFRHVKFYLDRFAYRGMVLLS
jgi:hypothetical protein